MYALFSCFVSLQADNTLAYYRFSPYHVQDVVEIEKVYGIKYIYMLMFHN